MSTPVAEYYKNTTVFITGATGFVGKAILEKLLRSCPDIKRIYVLIRPKKGVNHNERLEILCNSKYFDKLKSKNPNFKNYISIINGNIEEDNLGLSETDINILINEVNIVFHVAATVRFDEKLKKAVQLNIIAVKSLLNISKTFRNLKSFVHVSTAYSHCYKSEIKEEFHEAIRDPNELIEYLEKLKEDEIDDASIIGEYPNTYTYTKGLGEELVRIEGKGLPICIVRPSIVLGPWTEPVPGWVDNFSGPLAIAAGTGMGIVHVTLMDGTKKSDFIPVDMTTNAIIVAATTNSKQTSDNSIKIYQIVTGNTNPVTWSDSSSWTNSFGHSYVPSKAIWSIFVIVTSNTLAFKIFEFFLHTIPGHILDFLLKIQGKKTMFGKIYKKYHSTSMLLKFFSKREWKMHDDNTRKLFFSLDEKDQEIFNFDVKQIEWDLFILYNIRFLRINLMEDPLSSITEGRKKLRRFTIVNNILFALFLYLMYYYVYSAIF